MNIGSSPTPRSYVGPVLLATLITGALFVLMQRLIKPSYSLGSSSNAVSLIRFVPPPPTPPPVKTERIRRPPEPDPIRQPQAPETQLNVSRPSPSRVADIGSVGLLSLGGNELSICAPGAACEDQIREGELMPLVQIPPIYPRRAAQSGISGLVTLEFTVNTDGSVSDVVVVSAEPPGLFDRAATKALLRWRFRPRLVDGQAVVVRAAQTLEFSLAD